ncbi:hypothetical protein Ahy_A07g035923 [Arachis hypogaea]|uniref:Protein FAR1-RELATED SEQUENCE n=1 Tax=Arachis hypogaea TaxID=3818 RepID=A0A445CEQ2_ARAHY|nr:hypothetical protein Ahy_A07g035923 [Arachis hypogaea]
MGFFAHLSGGYRNVNFIRKDLYNYMDDVCNPALLKGTLQHFGLEDNDWIASTYEKKKQWTHAYLCDKFCAGLRTTSRCEGINSSLKKFIKSENCLLEMVENLDRVVKDYCNNKFIADYKSLYTDLVLLTRLESLEWSTSIPYGHIFCVLKELDIKELPDRLVLKRWCKDAKSDRISIIEVQSDPERAFRIRYDALWAACLKMCFLAAQGSETYEKVVNVVAKTSNELESMCYVGNKGGQAHPTGNDIDIGNPHIKWSKGAPRGSTNAKSGRCCRRCFGFGHDRHNCLADEDNADEFPGRGEPRAVAEKGAGIHSICKWQINVGLLEMKYVPLSCVLLAEDVVTWILSFN